MRLPAGGLRRGVALACVLVCLAIYGYWGVWLPLHATGYDFTGPYEAAYALVHHAPLQVYDVPAQRAYNDAVLHLPDGPSDFRWTPPTAVLLIPLALLPYRVARLVWWVLGQAALIAALWLLARCVAACISFRTKTSIAAPARRQESETGNGSVSAGATCQALLVLCCAAAIAQPVTDSLRLGQSTTILLLGFALIAYGEVFDQQTLAGLGLGIAILDKLFPAALLLYFLWRGRYRVCAAAVALVAGLCVITLPVTGFGMYGAFVQGIRTYSNTPNAGPVNLSPAHAIIVGASALFRSGQPEPATGALPALAALVCAALFGALLLAQGRPRALDWFRRHGESASPGTAGGAGAFATFRDNLPTARRQLFAVSWAVCSLLVLEPIDWIFYYLLLLIPLAWLLTRPDRPTDKPSAPGGWWLAGLLAYFVATLPLPLDSRTAPPMSPAFVAGICVRPAALLVLWAAHAALGSGYGRRRALASDMVRDDTPASPIKETLATRE